MHGGPPLLPSASGPARQLPLRCGPPAGLQAALGGLPGSLGSFGTADKSPGRLLPGPWAPEAPCLRQGWRGASLRTWGSGLGVAPPMTGGSEHPPWPQTPGPDRRPLAGAASPDNTADLSHRAGSRPPLRKVLPSARHPGAPVLEALPARALCRHPGALGWGPPAVTPGLRSWGLSLTAGASDLHRPPAHGGACPAVPGAGPPVPGSRLYFPLRSAYSRLVSLVVWPEGLYSKFIRA